MNLRDAWPAAAKLSEAMAGFSTRRSLPKWRSDVFRDPPGRVVIGKKEVVLFADTFNRYFERENLDAALAVLTMGGYHVRVAKPADNSSRPLCCGRTFLSIGRWTRRARKRSGRLRRWRHLCRAASRSSGLSRVAC